MGTRGGSLCDSLAPCFCVYTEEVNTCVKLTAGKCCGSCIYLLAAFFVKSHSEVESRPERNTSNGTALMVPSFTTETHLIFPQIKQKNSPSDIHPVSYCRPTENSS